jgi:Arc/MetJ-type ribon-helix-helix transcriptional regulator
MSPKKRASADDPLEKTGYRLPRSLVMRVREAVDAGEAKSQNEFVEQALRRELSTTRQRRLYASYAEAVADPDYVARLEAEAGVWDATAGDGLASDDAP